MNLRAAAELVANTATGASDEGDQKKKELTKVTKQLNDAGLLNLTAQPDDDGLSPFLQNARDKSGAGFAGADGNAPTIDYYQNELKPELNGGYWIKNGGDDGVGVMTNTLNGSYGDLSSPDRQQGAARELADYFSAPRANNGAALDMTKRYDALCQDGTSGGSIAAILSDPTAKSEFETQLKANLQAAGKSDSAQQDALDVIEKYMASKSYFNDPNNCEASGCQKWMNNVGDFINLAHWLDTKLPDGSLKTDLQANASDGNLAKTYNDHKPTDIASAVKFLLQNGNNDKTFSVDDAVSILNAIKGRSIPTDPNALITVAQSNALTDQRSAILIKAGDDRLLSGDELEQLINVP